MCKTCNIFFYRGCRIECLNDPSYSETVAVPFDYVSGSYGFLRCRFNSTFMVVVLEIELLGVRTLHHRAPRQSVCNLKDLYGNITSFVFKAKYRGNVDIFLQNKRKLTSIVVVCRPSSRKWRILANFGEYWRF